MQKGQGKFFERCIDKWLKSRFPWKIKIDHLIKKFQGENGQKLACVCVIYANLTQDSRCLWTLLELFYRYFEKNHSLGKNLMELGVWLRDRFKGGYFYFFKNTGGKVHKKLKTIWLFKYSILNNQIIL